jgi:hypothetical protein
MLLLFERSYLFMQTMNHFVIKMKREKKKERKIYLRRRQNKNIFMCFGELFSPVS